MNGELPSASLSSTCAVASARQAIRTRARVHACDMIMRAFTSSAVRPSLFSTACERVSEFACEQEKERERALFLVAGLL